MFCVYLLNWIEFQREVFMLWCEEESEQTENMEKKKSFGESEETAIHAICFKEQIGHFQQLLDVFGISSNLEVGFWNLPYQK